MNKLSGKLYNICLKNFCGAVNARNKHWAIIGVRLHVSASQISHHRLLGIINSVATSGRLWCHRHRHVPIASPFSTAPSGQQGDSTVDWEEVDKFNHLSKTMWNENGGMRGLHSLNQLRVPLIRDVLLHGDGRKGDTEQSAKPLQGITILDVGCGAGILSEPLSRLGAQVTGLDAAHENISVAKWHSDLDPELAGKVRYICGSVEDLSTSGTDSEKYDGVVASEILEHVANTASFVSACCALVKPGGSIFFTTINKSALAFLVAKVTAEYILRIVDPGTHDWEKFVTPEDLQSLLSANGMNTRLVHGMTWNPLTNKWCWIQQTDVNYAVHAVKPISRELDSQSDSSSDSEADTT